MCKGQDEAKPHLHYPVGSRMIAMRLESLSSLESSDVLRLAVAIGLQAICDYLSQECKEVAAMVDGQKYAKLVSTRAMATQTIGDIRRELSAWIADPIKDLRLMQEDLPF